MSDWLERLVSLEADVRYREPAQAGERTIGYVDGSTPVLLSAPHSAIHTRRGEPKEEEEFTAAMACLVAEETGAHALYARRKSTTDPNWYPDTPYKRRLRRILAQSGISYVLDVHGAAPDRAFGIALGTMGGESCPECQDEIVRTLEQHGFRRRADSRDPLDILDVDNKFTARGKPGQETITSFVWERLGVPCAQFELHPGLRVVERREDATLPRPFHGDPERIRRIVRAFVHLIRRLTSKEAAVA